MKIFAQRLRELRQSKGMSQKELAAVLHTTNSSICDWECERTEPNLESLVALAAYFGTSADYLLGIKEY
jgi:transcriptional regulator with XRE-family HTH domain